MIRAASLAYTTERERQLVARAGFLDLLKIIQENQVHVSPAQQHRIAGAWDCIRLPEDTPLQFYSKQASPIILPIGPTARMPT